MGNPDTQGGGRSPEGPMTLDEALSAVSAVLFESCSATILGCEAILTNDARLRRVDHPRAIILDDFVGEQTE